jgi:hypothetical protein
MRASELPTPLPTNPLEYVEWQEKPAEARELDEDAEDAWLELDRMVVAEPSVGWRVLTELASRCNDEDACAQIAAGPLKTSLRAHGDAFSSPLAEELTRNGGFRAAFNWLKQR